MPITLFLKRGVTLVELIIATVLIASISLAIWSIVMFSRYQVTNAEIRARVQNSASLAMDHLTRNLSQAIGNTVIAAQLPIDTSNIGAYRAIKFWIDDNPRNGRQDATDTVMAYRWRDNGGDRYELQFCASCQDIPNKINCNSCNPPWAQAEVVATNIEYFGTFNPPGPVGPPTIDADSRDCVSVQIQACHDAAAGDCGTSVDNPRVTLRARIRMPAVSTR